MMPRLLTSFTMLAPLPFFLPQQPHSAWKTQGNNNSVIMQADRLLTTVLRAFQDAPNPEQTNRMLSSTTSLLTTLSNPLNVTLLTSQLLQAPGIRDHVNGLQTSLRMTSIFNTAAITVRKHQLEGREKPYDAYQPRLGGGINCDDWATAVIKGLDDRSPRWRHVLVIGGVLLGMEGQDRRGLSRGLRMKLEGAMVKAANLALEGLGHNEFSGAESVVLALNHAFPLLSDTARRDLNYDAFVMIMVQSMTSIEGYEDGLFLEQINSDVKQASGSGFEWSAKSPSFSQLEKLVSKPLVSSMGPLSRLIAHAIENLRDQRRILEVQDHLLRFSERVFAAWLGNKLSGVDPSEEGTFLAPDTLRTTVPVLWQVLKTTMFATLVILRAIVGRTLIDPVLSGKSQPPATAAKSLHTLRNLYFISSRLGSNAFSAYTFVNITSIDILSRHSLEARDFLKSIYPNQAGQIPTHPLLRNLDLFYLNTSEHFTLALCPTDSKSLIVTAASPYLNPTANAHLLEIFEAAHSAMLAVLAAPQNAQLAAQLIPFYVDSLFNSFPKYLSPRQFRFAFKALMQITTPPSPLSASQPLLSETLLELLHHRALHAPTTPLPPFLAIKSESDAQLQEKQPPLSEQAVLLLTLLDALPCLPLSILEDWLRLTADLLNAIDNGMMREYCKARCWEVLESGEMDIERSAVCVGWWSTRGGKEKVLFGRDREEGPFMSGGLGPERNESRL